MIVAAMLALSLSPAMSRARVDICEVNHVTGDDGTERFTQVILWRWIVQPKMHSGFHVAQYFMLDGEALTHRVDGKWRVLWRGRDGIAYEATTRQFRETWTKGDPEVADRDRWQEAARRPYFPGAR